MSNRCEDYPCCGHGPPPGDGGGCPNAAGQFDCVGCGRLLPVRASSALCTTCRSKPRLDEEDSDDFETYSRGNGRARRDVEEQPW